MDRDEKRHSLTTLTIASLSSAAAAVVVHHLWRAGTILGAAATPVLVTLFAEALRRPVERVKVPARRPSAGGESIRIYRSRPRFAPMAVTALAAFAIFQFMWVWNDLLVALVFLGPQDNVAVATVKLTQLVGNRGEQWHVLTAAAFISMLLPLLVFLALQRYFIRGILAGSVKG